MRSHRIANYESILQALVEKGCPLCAYLKNYQAALLQDPSGKKDHHLCSFHTGGLAATQNPVTTADLFWKLLDRPIESFESASCDIWGTLGRVAEFLTAQRGLHS